MTTRMTANPSSTSVLPTGEAKVARIIMTSSRTRPKLAAAPAGAVPEILVERSVTVWSALSPQVSEAGYQLAAPASRAELTNAASPQRRRAIQKAVHMTSAGVSRPVTESSSKLLQALPLTL